MRHPAPAIQFRSVEMVAHQSEPRSTSPVARALFITQAQDKFLHKARAALDRMLQLTILSQAPAHEHNAEYRDEFETLVNFLEKLAGTEIDGIKLFHTANLIVDLPELSDTLILPGIDLSQPTFRRALSTKLDPNCDHPSVAAALQNANRWIAIGRSMITANLERLSFLDQRLDAVKASVLPLPTPTNRMSSGCEAARELHPTAAVRPRCPIHGSGALD